MATVVSRHLPRYTRPKDPCHISSEQVNARQCTEWFSLTHAGWCQTAPLRDKHSSLPSQAEGRGVTSPMILLNWRSDSETSSPPVPQPSLQSLLLVVLALPELPDDLGSCSPGSPC